MTSTVRYEPVLRPPGAGMVHGIALATLRAWSSIRPTSVRHLQVFCAAARNLSFKQAAKQLHLTPSAVSHRIRELEADLGIELFERRIRAVELTEAGRTMFNEIAPLLDAVEQSLTNVAQRLQKQRLRVTAPQFFASESLIPKLSGFGVRWPQVDLRLDSMEPRPSAHPADADASILISAERPDGVRAVPLFELRLAAMCSPKYRSAIGPLNGRLPTDTVLLTHKSWPDGWLRWAEATGTEVGAPCHARRVRYDIFDAESRRAWARPRAGARPPRRGVVARRSADAARWQ